ncbi:MAG: hypothetical protein WCK16_00630 [Candidatus Moraniibacteriota bacterium]
MQKNPLKQKVYFSQKIISGFFIFLLILFSFSCPKKAQAWDAMAASVYETVVAEISYSIKGMMMGSLKQAAIKMLSKQMDRFISGVGGNGARFITNWEDYLVNNPKRNATNYANDYISRLTSGRGSVNYKKASNSVLGASTIAGEGFGRGAVLGDDAADITSSSLSENIQTLGENITEPKEWRLSYDGDPAEMFQSDSLANMNLYLMGDGNGGNTIWDADSAIRAEYNTALAKEKATATAEGIAGGGFLSEKIDGMIAKPGILYKEMEANMENLPNLAISSATSIGELVAATVSKAIAGAVNKTISGVENKINKEVNKVTDKAVNQVNKKVNAYGPGALYKK